MKPTRVIVRRGALLDLAKVLELEPIEDVDQMLHQITRMTQILMKELESRRKVAKEVEERMTALRTLLEPFGEGGKELW